MSFYHYSQNNSGGGFDVDHERGLSHHVIVEAESPAEATLRAERIGLYFDGYGDCPCCGDRWYETSHGDPQPSVYGEPVEIGGGFNEDMGFIKWIDGPEGYVHFADGRVEAFGV